MSNNSNVTPYGVSSKKSKRNKICRSIYAYKKKNNLPIIVEFTPRLLIPFLSSTDVKYTKYIKLGNSEEYRAYWKANLKQTFIRNIANDGCIRKLDEGDQLTLDTKLRHYPDRTDGEICSTFMRNIAQNNEQQSAGGMGSKIVTLSNYEVHDAVFKTLRNVTASTNVTGGNKEYYKILSDNLFKDEKELCVHGLHWVVRGQIYNKQYNTGNFEPLSVNNVKWKFEGQSWVLTYNYDYSNLGDLVGVVYIVGNGTMQVYMQEVQPGYCLNNEQLNNFYNHTIGVLNHSFLMEVPYELIEDVRYDINEDIPASFIHAYDPDLVNYLKFLSPSGEVEFPRYDFRNAALKGSYFQIYLKKKLIGNEFVDVFRFEISIRSASAVKTLEDHPAILRFVKRTLMGDDFGGIITLHEDSIKAGGEGVRDAFNLDSKAPYMGMIDEFVELRVSSDKHLKEMKMDYSSQIGNITHTTVVNSMVMHKLANEVQKFQDYDLNGMVQQQLVLSTQLEEMLANPVGITEEQVQKIMQGIISNQQTIEKLGGGHQELIGSNSLIADNISQLQEDFLTTKEILDREVSNSVKTTEILSELKNNTYGKIGDHAVFKTEYLIENISEIALDYRSAVQNIQFVTHKKKLVTKRVVNGIVLQEVIDLFIMDPHWKSLLQIRNSIKRKEAIVRNAIYLGLDADPSIFQSKIGKRKNSVLYNLYKGNE